jgi:hypothetical protein
MNESVPLTSVISPIVRGVVHGKMIELESPLNIADGETEEVRVRIVSKPPRSLKGILKASSAFANDPRSDADFEFLERQRKSSFSRDIKE